MFKRVYKLNFLGLQLGCARGSGGLGPYRGKDLVKEVYSLIRSHSHQIVMFSGKFLPSISTKLVKRGCFWVDDSEFRNARPKQKSPTGQSKFLPVNQIGKWYIYLLGVADSEFPNPIPKSLNPYFPCYNSKKASSTKSRILGEIGKLQVPTTKFSMRFLNDIL